MSFIYSLIVNINETKYINFEVIENSYLASDTTIKEVMQPIISETPCIYMRQEGCSEKKYYYHSRFVTIFDEKFVSNLYHAKNKKKYVETVILMFILLEDQNQVKKYKQIYSEII